VVNLVEDILFRAKQHNIVLFLKEGKLSYVAEQGGFPADLKTQVGANKDAIIAHLESLQKGDPDEQTAPFSLLTAQELPRFIDTCEDAYPLTALQSGMVFHSQLEDFNGMYHDFSTEQLKFPWFEQHFATALKHCVGAHPVLRTGYDFSADRPIQFVRKQMALPLVVEDICDKSEDEQTRYLADWRETRKTHVFDWAQGALWQINIFLLSADSFEFTLSFHHSVLDGWSRSVLTTELYDYYLKLLQDQPLSVTEDDWVLRDYVALEQAAIQGEQAKSYFGQMLEDVSGQQLPLLNPTIDEQALQQQTFKSDQFFDRSEALLTLSREMGVPIQAVLLSVHLKVLATVSGQNKVMTCVTTNGRPQQEAGERGIGLFLNSVPMALTLADASWRQLIEQVATLVRTNFSHRHYPLMNIQQDLGVEFSEVLFNYTHFHVLKKMAEQETSQQAGAELLAQHAFEQTNFTFAVDVSRAVTGDGMDLFIKYDSHLYSSELVNQVGQFYITAIDRLLNDIDSNHQSCSLLGEAQLQQQLVRWNQTPDAQTRFAHIHQGFEQQVEIHSDKVAVVDGQQQLSYSQLNQQVNQLARYLLEQGVKSGDLVGLSVPRSVNMLVGILAILKTGAAYLPIEASYPADRLDYLASDSGIDICISTSEQNLPSTLAGIRMDVDLLSLSQHSPQYSSENLNIQIMPEQMAYMIYTSGSTGLPKGVKVPHCGVVNYLTHTHQHYLSDAHQGGVVSSPLSFDATVTSLFTPLWQGKCVAMLPEVHEELVEGLLSYLFDSTNPWLFKLTPAHLEMLLPLAQGKKVQSRHTLVLGGEQLNSSTLAKWQQSHLPKAAYINEYGPTETVVGCSYYQVDDTNLVDTTQGAVAIGRPIQGTQLYVLNADRQVVPQGTTGELYIGGQGVTLGYHNRDDLSQSRFVANPFIEGGRLYRSGDLVRYHSNGQLDYIGREDEQVKIRGYRIELGEINHQLTSLPQVSESVVIINQSSAELVAYVVAEQGVEVDDLAKVLKSGLSDRVPEYMVPHHFVLLEQMPLTTNGKIDRKALPKDLQRQSSHYVAPRNEVESAIATVWQQTLGIEQVGIEDNFFTLGGDSILSIQLVSKAAQAGIEFTTRQLFEYQTIAELSGVVKTGVVKEAPQEAITGALTLLPIQQAFLADDQPKNHYNQSVLLETPADFSSAMLNAIIAAIFNRHDALRVRCNQINGQWQLEHQPLTEQMLAQTCIVETLPLESERLTERCNHHQASLNINDGPLIKAVFFKGENSGRLLIAVHHLVVDGVSWRVLLSDLESAQQQYAKGQNIKLDDKTSSFKQWGEALADYAISGKADNERDYWLAQLQAAVPALAEHQALAQHTSANVEIALDKAQTNALLTDCPKAYRTYINELLLTGVYLGVKQWNQQDQLRITLEGHGREELFEQLDLSQTLGWFTTTYPLLLSTDGDISVDDTASTIKTIKEQLRAIPNNGIGYGVLRHLKQDAALADLEASQPNDLIFNYLGQFDQMVQQQSAFEIAAQSMGEPTDPNRLRSHTLGLNGMVAGGQLRFVLDYCEQQFSAEQMQQLADNIKNALLRVINHCSEVCAGGGTGQYTVSDFPNARLDQTVLEQLQQQHSIDKLYVATPMQQGLLFHTMLEKPAYINQVCPLFNGNMDLGHFRQAWQCVVERYDIFRTAFVAGETRLHQLVVDSVELPWLEYDWTAMTPQQQETKFEQVKVKDRSNGFDLQQVPLQRISMFKLADDRYQMMWSYHHMLLDGWCTPIVYGEVMQAYYQLLQNQTPQLGKAPVYENYIGWMLAQDVKTAQQFWQQHLAGFTAATGLFEDYPVGMQSDVKGHQQLLLSQADSGRLARLAKTHKTTVNTLVQFAWGLLLSRYANEQQVVFGTIISGRPAAVVDVSTMVGLFINSIPVKVDFDFADDFATLISDLHDKFQSSNEFGYLPLNEIQKQTGVPGGSPLFNSLLVFENYPLDSAMGDNTTPAASQLTLQSVDVNTEDTYNLTLSVSFTDVLSVTAEFDNSAFSSSCIERMLGHLNRIFDQLEQCRSVADISLLCEEDTQLINQWSAKAALTDDTLKASYLVQLNAHVNATPDSIAVVSSEGELTYAELDRLSSRLAAYLDEMDVVDGARVGIYLPRSLAQMIAVVGINKAGASYVPLEPGLPAQRLTHMINDAEVELVLLSSGLIDTIALAGVDVLLMDDVSGDDWLSDFAQGFEAREISSQQEAYVLYTSGSTGLPKGVQLTHENLSHYLAHAQTDYLGDHIRGSVVSSPLCFDATLTTLLTPLCVGKSVHLLGDGDKALSQLPQYLFNQDSNWLFKLTPAHLDALVYSAEQPMTECGHHTIVVGGEQLRLASLNHYKGNVLPNARFINEYGPTETVVGTSVFSVNTSDDLAALQSQINVPIGQPIAGSQLFVVDTAQQLQPVNNIGELYIAGAGVGVGYCNLKQQTEQRFSEFNGQRVYKTGDLVRWLPNGELSFVGRSDHQVKIRGYRIELGEISEQLLALDTVHEAVAIALKLEGQEPEGKEPTLVVYVVSPQFDSEQFRQHLQASLPEYMVPVHFVEVAKMPLTANGKVDVKALPAPLADEQDEAQYVAPTTSLERQLCQTWIEVMDAEQVGINDNFFSLGGDSILAIRVVSLLKREALFIDIKDVFTYPTIAQLAAFILSCNGEQRPEQVLSPFELLNDAERIRVQAALGDDIVDAYPLSTLQAGMVFHSQIEKFNGVYHDVNAEHIKCPWHQAHFTTALAACISSHPILRTGFDLSGERSLQVVYQSMDLPLIVEDIRNQSIPAQKVYLTAWIESRKLHVFDWINGPLFQVNIFLRSDESFEFVISFHHSVLDGWSRASFSTELYNHYERLLSGKSIEAPAPEWVYRDFIALEQASIDSGEALLYFEQMLAQAPQQQVPYKTGADKTATAQHQTHAVYDLEPYSTDLFALAKQLGTPIQSVLLAVHLKVLTLLSGEKQALSCVTHNGRPEQEGAEQGLGLYLNSLPLSLELQDGSWAELIAQTAKLSADTLNHRRFPLAEIQRLAGREFAEVTFNYTNFHVFKDMNDSQEFELDLLESRAFEQTSFDFHIDISKALVSDSLFMAIHFNSHLYEEKFVKRVAGYYVSAFSQMLEASQAPHHQAILLSGAELAQIKDWSLAETFSETSPEASLETSPEASLETSPEASLETSPEASLETNSTPIPQQFARQVATTPEAIAVVSQGIEVSYAQLDELATKLSAYLQELNIATGCRVAIYLPRGIAQMVAVVGINKAGAAYVPLEPGLPLERLQHMADDADVDLVLLNSELLAAAPLQGVDVLLMTDVLSPDWLMPFADGFKGVDISADDEAYVLYTSGSTGMPKGVSINHGNLSHYLTHAQNEYLPAHIRGSVVSSPLCFDATLTTLLAPLCTGKSVHLIGDGEEALQELPGYLFSADDNWLFKLTPAHLDFLMYSNTEAVDARHIIVVGGEQWLMASLTHWKGQLLPNSRFVNEYGPTETVVGTSVHTIDELDLLDNHISVPIGRPIAGSELFVVGANEQKQPINCVGELYIGGGGVGVEYINRAEQSAQSFGEHAGQRVYKTGDLVRWLDSGVLEFIGRSDHQVKLRGYRIELDEISQQLLSLENVLEAAVVFNQDYGLAAYMVAPQWDEEQLVENARKHLLNHLPDYMIPSFFVGIEKMPLTLNGKVDTRALPAPQRSSGAEYVPAQTDTQKVLIDIWSELLKVPSDKISILDHFFAHGGHSLLVVRLVHEIGRLLEVQLDIIDVYKQESLQQLASQIDQILIVKQAQAHLDTVETEEEGWL
jgi:amino acid adenylation domain-containing protein/non-ribosomal peptide synthase protein (TIGR01720 family)